MRFLFGSMFLLALVLNAPGAAANSVAFTVDVNLSGTGVEELELELLCDLDEPLVLTFPVAVDTSKTFSVPIPPGRETTCRLTTQALPGHALKFLGDGGSTFDPEGAGCTFRGVQPGHANFCQVQVESRETSLTVFKHWIGTSKREEDVTVRIDCGQGWALQPLRVNADRPGSWRLEVNDANGVVCSVMEDRGDSYIGNAEDCQGLLILPGALEECTLVNTKVVKMIEMLNRYGLVVMIGVFMLVGGFAARKFIP